MPCTHTGAIAHVDGDCTGGIEHVGCCRDDPTPPQAQPARRRYFFVTRLKEHQARRWLFGSRQVSYPMPGIPPAKGTPGGGMSGGGINEH